MDNEYVKALLVVMQNNNSPSIKDFVDILKQVTAMEQQLNNAVGELSAMRKQLDEARAMNHPALAAMERTVINTQNFVSDLRDKLAEIKENIINGCKNALDAVKEKGITALNSIMDFFKIKPALESIRNDMSKNIAYDNRQIDKIETISKNYHEAGKHLKISAGLYLAKNRLRMQSLSGKWQRHFVNRLKLTVPYARVSNNTLRLP